MRKLKPGSPTPAAGLGEAGDKNIRMTMTTQPTIALLPGLLCDAAIWEGVRADLAAFAPVVVGDFSQSDSIEDMAARALAAADGPLVVIGHSMGGRVALEVVRAAPERVKGLALLDTGIHPRRDGEEAKREVLVRLAYDQGMAALADAWLPPMVLRNDDAELMAPMRAMVMRASPEQHERQIRALLNRPDAATALQDILCPTLVMVGRHDQWSPVAQHEEIAARIPGSRLVVIEDSGHMAPLEQSRATAAALSDWLRSAVFAV